MANTYCTSAKHDQQEAQLLLGWATLLCDVDWTVSVSINEETQKLIFCINLGRCRHSTLTFVDGSGASEKLQQGYNTANVNGQHHATWHAEHFPQYLQLGDEVACGVVYLLKLVDQRQRAYSHVLHQTFVVQLMLAEL